MARVPCQAGFARRDDSTLDRGCADEVGVAADDRVNRPISKRSLSAEGVANASERRDGERVTSACYPSTRVGA
jgi:hypothetical protein